MSAIDKVRISCPKCRKRLAVKASRAARRVRCPDTACATLITVPAQAPDPEGRPRLATPARWPWIAGAAALAFVLMLGAAVGVGIWALNRGDPPAVAAPLAGAPVPVAKTDAAAGDGAGVNKATHAFKAGDWFLWKHSIDSGKTTLTSKHTITSADDKTIFYDVESASSANKDVKKETGKFAVALLGKSPIPEGDARNEILGTGKATLHVGGKSIACDWVEYKSNEAGDPMKYKINGVAYGETIVTNAKVWYSAQVPALAVKNESRTSHVVPPQVLKKWAPADVSSTYELIDLGNQATVAVETKQPKGLTKEGLRGLWEGRSKDGTVVELIFRDDFVTVAILPPGVDLTKGRDAAEYVSGDFGRGLTAGGCVMGNAAYALDAAKKEIKIDGAVARPGEDGTLVVAGAVRLGTAQVSIPETSIGRVPPKSGPADPAKQPADVAASFAALAGEWAELKLGHYLHLDPDGFGYCLARLFGVHTVEIRVRRTGGDLILDFPDEVSFGPGRRELRSKPMTIRLPNPATLELFDASGMLWYRLTRSTVTRDPPMRIDFAGDWKAWSVTADGKAGKDLAGFERVLKLKDMKLTLSPSGKGIARFARADQEQGLSFKQVGGDFILGELEGQDWQAKFFYTGAKKRVLRLRTQDGTARVYAYAQPIGKTPTDEPAKEKPPDATKVPEKPQTLPPEAGSLPKPKGPRLMELAKPPGKVVLDGIYLAGPFMRGQRAKEWPQAFPAGTDETCVVVVLKSAPLGTQVAVEVASAAGPVRLAPSTYVMIQTGAQVIIELTCAPASGVYADGDYTTTVHINRTAVARLHWCVGGTEPVRDAIALAGTVWQSRHGDGSGYELRFGDGGKLDVRALPSAGKSTWQTKKGTWQQQGATFTGFADQDGAPRRRIELRGKQIDGALAIRIRNESENTPGSFGSWYEVPRARKK